LKVNVIVVGINLLNFFKAYLVGCESFYKNPTENLLSLVYKVLGIFVGQNESVLEVNFGI
jgi:ABC-type uncharacterized transport system permease subunit